MPVSEAQLDEVFARIAAGETAHALESPILDFKRQPGSKPDAIKTIVDAAICFANGVGGTVVMGVANASAGAAAFLGCDLNALTVQRRVHELTEPQLMVGARTQSFGSVRLLVVDVFQSFDIHSDKQGKATHRVGTSCEPLTPRANQRLREERLPVDWSAQPSGRTAEDVSAKAIAAAREALRRASDDRAPLADLTDEDLLRALGVLGDDGALNRTGELLFCEAVAEPVQLIYQYRQTPGGEAVAVERLRFPLITAFERAMNLIWARRNVTPLTLPNGQQIEIADFPEAAVREALSNALIHRDYRLDQRVNIEHSPAAFVVISPGSLVGSVTSQNILTHASTPRNPALARAARVLRLAEETGRGVDRMYREMIRSGQEVPLIEDGTDFVRVVLSGGAPRTSISRFVAQLPVEEREDTDAMLVLYTLCRRRTVSSVTMAPILQKGEAETELILRRLAHDTPGILEPTRESARARRRQFRLRGDALRALGTAVRYNRRTIDETDRKVVSHVAEYGRVTNRTLQNMFDIDVFRARDLLADLQSRGILIRTSEVSRGRNVEYGPGPKFPRPRHRLPRKAPTKDQ